MTTPRPAAIAAVIILCLIVSPCTSVPVLYDETVSEYVSTSSQGELYHTSGSNTAGNWQCLQFTDITKHPDLTYIVIDIAGNQGYWTADNAYLTVGRHDFSYTFNGKTRPGVIYVDRSTNALGAVTTTKFTIFLNDWDIGSLTGPQVLPLPFYIYKGTTCDAGVRTAQAVYPTGNAYPTGAPYPHQKMTVTVSSGISWKNHITIDDTDGGYVVAVNRTVDGAPYTSTLNTSLHGNVIHTSTLHGAVETLWYDKTAIDLVEIISPSGSKYPYSLSSPTSPAPVTIYVKRSDTGALLAGANLLLETAPDVAGWSEYFNGTLESGLREFSLPTSTEATPYQYRVTASYPGYTERVPLQHFNTWGGTPRNIIIEMAPTLDAPTDPEKTFLQFYVRDTSANPILGAAVEVDGQWLYTNNNGYARFAVAKNATYPYSVSKSGYMTISGSATVEGDSSYTVNVVLGLGSIPTNPPATSGPGDTPGPGPTPDRRTNEEKGQAVIDMVADNAEGLGALALICLLVGLLKLMVKW